MYFTVLLTFKNIGRCQVGVRLKLGFFSDANVLENLSKVDVKVGVRLKLGCGLN